MDASMLPETNHLQAASVCLDARGLTKRYRRRLTREGAFAWIGDLVRPLVEHTDAVREVDISVAEGECVGLLGPNGAGKTTLIKLMCGIQTPDAGTLNVLGHVPHRRERDFYRQIGVVFGHKSSLWWDLPVWQSFRFCRSLYGIPAAAFERNLAELTRSLRLDHVLMQPVRSLSLGERVKAELASALLHEPKLLLLDEPTVGLDVMAKAELRRHLNLVKRTQGVSIILTSHDVGDIEACCDRIVLLKHGCVEMNTPFEAFRGQVGAVVSVSISPRALAYSASDLAHLRGWLGARGFHDAAQALSEGAPVTLSLYRDDMPGAVSALAGLASVSYEIRRPSLEQCLVSHFNASFPVSPEAS
jgi:ABC-2 type transport system ATP-binding protein